MPRQGPAWPRPNLAVPRSPRKATRPRLRSPTTVCPGSFPIRFHWSASLGTDAYPIAEHVCARCIRARRHGPHRPLSLTGICPGCFLYVDASSWAVSCDSTLSCRSPPEKRTAHACAVQPQFAPAPFPFVFIGVPHLALMHILLLSMCVQGASGHAVTDLIVR